MKNNMIIAVMILFAAMVVLIAVCNPIVTK